jgi:hypothetical protein
MLFYSCNATPGKDRLTTLVPLVVAFPLRGKFISVLMYEVHGGENYLNLHVDLSHSQ